MYRFSRKPNFKLGHSPSRQIATSDQKTALNKPAEKFLKILYVRQNREVLPPIAAIRALERPFPN